MRVIVTGKSVKFMRYRLMVFRHGGISRCAEWYRRGKPVPGQHQPDQLMRKYEFGKAPGKMAIFINSG